LEKDRSVRYQSAVELRADLKRLKRDTDAGVRPATAPRPAPPLKSRFRLFQKEAILPSTWRRAVPIVLSLLGVFLLIGAYFILHDQFLERHWDPRRLLESTKADAALTFRNLTSTTPTDFIEYAGISPDGKYFVYAKKSGSVFLSTIDTGDTRTLVQAKGDVYPGSWFPDGTQLLIAKADISLWKASVLTGRMTKLGDNIGWSAVSPDGTHILYEDMHRHAIWIMGADGEGAHEILKIDPSEVLHRFVFSPDGRRFAYNVHRDRSDGTLDKAIRISGLDEVNPVEVISNERLVINNGGFAWLKDGRLIVPMSEPAPNPTHSTNLWSLRIDPNTGKAYGDLKQLSHWTGFTIQHVSYTPDGRRLMFIKAQSVSAIRIASLENGINGFLNTEQLESDTWASSVDSWAFDSRSVYLSSGRSGRDVIYRQAIDQQVGEPLISGPDNYSGAIQVNPEGQLIYTVVSARDGPKVKRLASRTAIGGKEEILLEGDFEAYQCGFHSVNDCVLTKKIGDSLGFYKLDPNKGLASQPFTLLPLVGDWSLSRDGQRIAFIVEKDPPQLKILDRSTGSVCQVHFDDSMPHDWRLQTLGWSPDGSGLYVTVFTNSGNRLLSVTLQGRTKTLYQHDRDFIAFPKVAPDGQHLSLEILALQRDIAIVENP